MRIAVSTSTALGAGRFVIQTTSLSDMTVGEELECSCCERVLPRPRLHALNTPNSYICRRCGLWIVFRLRSDELNEHDRPAG